MPQPSALRRPHRAHAAEPAPQAALGGTDAKTPALAAIRPSQPAPWRGARRTQALAGLLHMWPWELQDQSPEAARRLLARLARHLIAERKRGIAGHWDYDPSRHARLARAFRAERARLNGTIERAHDARPPQDGGSPKVP